jgi:hypothetical protein
LLKQLTNPTGDPGEGHVEKTVVFSGDNSIKIIPMQRFHPAIPGWKHRIVEKPALGEYRYLRFAWKADGCAGIMLQMHAEKDWNIRYTAGIDQLNWGTKFVAERPPSEWKVVTCDLFKDFGKRTVTGIALTVFGGRAGYFDHIYLGRTIDDLDRIDATGVRKGKPPEPTGDELGRLWKELAGEDEAKGYRAFWTLTAAPKQAVPFLSRKLAPTPAKGNVAQIRLWISQLDDDAFGVREEASKQLAKHLEAAAPHLEGELHRDPSVEVRKRIERLLQGRRAGHHRTEKAIRVLEYSDAPEARKALEKLAHGPETARPTQAARAALKRLAGRRGK